MSKQYPGNTKRITFRCWSSNDIELAQRLWGCAEVSNFISSGGFTPDDINQRLAQEIDNQINHGVQYWPIYLTSDGSHLGCCGFRPYDGDPKVYEIGFHLHKEYWGMGLAKEAAEEAIRFAFSHLSVVRLTAGHHPENIGSASLLKKLGFEPSHKSFYEPTGMMHPMYFLQNPAPALTSMAQALVLAK